MSPSVSRRTAWLLTASLLLLGVYASTRLRLSEDVSEMLPSGNREAHSYRLLMESFQYVNGIIVDIEDSSRAPNRDCMVDTANRLHAEMLRSGLFSKVVYRFDGSEVGAALEPLGKSLPRLFTDKDLPWFDARLKDENINVRFQQFLQELSGIEGFMAKGQFERDPLGAQGIILEKLRGLDDRAGQCKISSGRMWNQSETHILLLAFPKSAAGSHSDKSTQIVDLLNRARTSVLATNPKQCGVQIHYLGAPFIAHDNAQAIRGDIARALLVANIAIALIGILFFRNKWLIWLMFIPPTIGANVALIAAAVFVPQPSGIALGFGAALIGITVDHSIYVLCMRDVRVNLLSTKLSGPLLGPVLLCSLTTFGAFVGMMFSTVPGLRQMGAFSALATLATGLFTVIIFPILVGTESKPAQCSVRSDGAFSSFYNHVAAASGRHLLALLFLAALAGIAAFLGCSHVRFTGEITALNHLSDRTLKDRQSIIEGWGQRQPSFIIVRGRTLEEALAQNDVLFENCQRMVASGNVQSFSSISALWPSSDTQKKNLARWQSFWTADKQAAVRKAANKAARSIGLRADPFSTWLALALQEPPPISLRTFAGSPFEELINQRLHTSDHYTLILTVISPSPKADIAFLGDHLQHGLTHSVWVNHSTASTSLGKSFSKDVAIIWLAAFCIVGIALLTFLRRIELVLLACVPVFASIALVVGFMGWLHIPLDIGNSLFMILLLGIGTDFSILVLGAELSGYQGHGEGRAGIIKSVFISAMASLAGFAAMACAQHPVLRNIGLTGMAGVFLNLVASIVFIPLAMRLFVPREPRSGVATLRRLLNGLAGFGWFGLTIWYYAAIRPFLQFVVGKDPLRRQEFARNYICHSSRFLMRRFPFIRFRLDVIDPQGDGFVRPAIVVFNHKSTFDIPLVMSLSPNMVLTVKDWVWRIPLIRGLLRDADYIPVKADGYESLLMRTREHLDKGVSVAVFPEGMRTPPDTIIGRFHSGAFLLASQIRTDILPVLITNTQRCIPWRSFWVQGARCSARLLPRVHSPDAIAEDTHRKQASRVRSEMMTFVEDDWTLCQDHESFFEHVASLYLYRGTSLMRRVCSQLRRDHLLRMLPSVVPKKGIAWIWPDPDILVGLLLAIHSRRRHVHSFGVDQESAPTLGPISQVAHNLAFTICDQPSSQMEPPCTIVRCMPNSLEYIFSAFDSARKHLPPHGLLILKLSQCRAAAEYASVQNINTEGRSRGFEPMRTLDDARCSNAHIVVFRHAPH